MKMVKGEEYRTRNGEMAIISGMSIDSKGVDYFYQGLVFKPNNEDGVRVEWDPNGRNIHVEGSGDDIVGLYNELLDNNGCPKEWQVRTEYRTRDNKKVILETVQPDVEDEYHAYPLTGYIDKCNGHTLSAVWSAEGKILNNSRQPYGNDIVGLWSNLPKNTKPVMATEEKPIALEVKTETSKDAAESKPMEFFVVGNYYRTRNGKKMQVVKLDAPGQHPIIGIALRDGLDPMPYSWGGNGKLDMRSAHTHPLDIICEWKDPKKPVKLEMYTRLLTPSPVRIAGVSCGEYDILCLVSDIETIRSELVKSKDAGIVCKVTIEEIEGEK